MSKIDELIAELCPEGVQYSDLGSLEEKGLVKLGRGMVISRGDLERLPGDFPVYSSSSIGDGEFGRYGNYMFADERITWSIDGGGKFFYRPAHKYSVTNVCGWLEVRDEISLSCKYLYYILSNLWVTKVYDYSKKRIHLL